MNNPLSAASSQGNLAVTTLQTSGFHGIYSSNNNKSLHDPLRVRQKQQQQHRNDKMLTSTASSTTSITKNADAIMMTCQQGEQQQEQNQKFMDMLKKRHNKLQQTSKGSRKVVFSTVEVRQYARCLGDNPSCSPDGPSLSIDWMYEPCGKIPVNRFERCRVDRRNSSRRSTSIQPLRGNIRRCIIRNHIECTKKQIEDNMKESEKVRRQRRATESSKRLDRCRLVLEKCQGWW